MDFCLFFSQSFQNLFMEPFIDGGLFELLFVLGFVYAINYIFLKKYMLIFYSAVSIISPILLIFSVEAELRYYLCGICIINSVLLITLLWKQRQTNPRRPLFDAGKLKDKIIRKKDQKVTAPDTLT